MSPDAIKFKLKSYSVKQGSNHQDTLTRFFHERFLYRLSQSPYVDHFLLKGGTLAYAYGAERSRHTRDIDLLLRKLQGDEKHIQSIFSKIAAIEIDDGVTFMADGVRISPITKEGRYKGTRVKLIAMLGNVRQGMQIDIGVGDHVTPGPTQIEFPTILSELPEPVLLAYNLETMLAEKFEAMISLGALNSRYKDFYDVYVFGAEAKPDLLELAVRNTFTRRNTVIIAHPIVFSDGFYLDAQRQTRWATFLRKNNLPLIDFTSVGIKILYWLQPIYERMKQR